MRVSHLSQCHKVELVLVLLAPQEQVVGGVPHRPLRRQVRGGLGLGDSPHTRLGQARTGWNENTRAQAARQQRKVQAHSSPAGPNETVVEEINVQVRTAQAWQATHSWHTHTTRGTANRRRPQGMASHHKHTHPHTHRGAPSTGAGHRAWARITNTHRGAPAAGAGHRAGPGWPRSTRGEALEAARTRAAAMRSGPGGAVSPSRVGLGGSRALVPVDAAPAPNNRSTCGGQGVG